MCLSVLMIPEHGWGMHGATKSCRTHFGLEHGGTMVINIRLLNDVHSHSPSKYFNFYHEPGVPSVPSEFSELPSVTPNCKRNSQA